ncbi:glycosyl hydrolase 115 family protein [Roseateles paludis]|uniref:Glycosyl hydrolase 115 family protein n=1 Tax=Roseateles paludis TaxID=3145238 RepID=A0ABV0G7N8_9BURK
MNPLPLATSQGLKAFAARWGALPLAPIVRRWAACLLVAAGLLPAHAALPAEVIFQPQVAGVALVQGGKPAAVLVDAGADAALQHVARSLAADLERVSGQPAPLVQAVAQLPAGRDVVLIAVAGQSKLLDSLGRARAAIGAERLTGRWEAFRQLVLEQPWPGVRRALVIVGSDRRGAVFGTYDLSERIGVSPWHWFADVPVTRRTDVTVAPGVREDAPKVKYRGFFINDEDPGLSGWAKKKFGGINAQMYAHVFELLLRLKGNYLWPAMWPPKAFNVDDPQNMVLADAMGVVMGTSHHEPLMRAHHEWHNGKSGPAAGGKWDYATNAANLREFWRGGIERMMQKGDGKGYDSLVTIGMRGDGDEAMAEDSAIGLLEQVVAAQRKILEDVTRKPAASTPQVWALYKEVQDYYDHGMQVPDDVTLLFADDNWGQIRRLPAPGAARPGGYGVYYHFDYVGAPRNYKWLNTNQIEKAWQQMDLAYAAGARALWIVNVGDIKPVEFPLSFFMQQAWNPERMGLAELARYPQHWARQSFGDALAEPVARLVTRYSQLVARRKPELIDAGSFKLGGAGPDVLDGGEFGRMVDEWAALEAQLAAAEAQVQPAQQSAFFQLVAHPIRAMANLYRLYYSVAWNRLLAAQGDARANAFADTAERAFRQDEALTDTYHRINDGKWDGMMAQTHIGYTYWNDPPKQTMPAVQQVSVDGVAPTPRFGALPQPAASRLKIFEAPDFAAAQNGRGLTWRVIPNLGRTAGAVTAFPQAQPATTLQDGVRLEYPLDLAEGGDLEVRLILVPTLDTSGKATLRVGVSIDDGEVQVLQDHQIPAPTTTTRDEQRNWNQAVMSNARGLSAHFKGVQPGAHRIKVWRLDDNVVLQRVVAAVGGVPPSYLAY